MDEIDRRILTLLQEDGRLPWIQLAERVGLSPPAVTERVKRLERDGVLTGIHAQLNPHAVGAATLAYVAVAITDTVEHQRFLDMAATTPEILECHVVAGPHDFLLKVRTESPEALAHLLRNTVRAIPGVASTSSTMVLESIKETGALRV